MKAYISTLIAILVLALAGSAMAANEQVGDAVKNTAPNQPKLREFKIDRAMSKEAQACLECHKLEHPGIFSDWAASRHASANITCLDCHLADETDPDVSQTHFEQYERSDTEWGTSEYRVPIAEVVTPKDCSRCHPDEVKQFSRSKHANTLEIIWKIDPWLNKGMNSATERQAGCYYCHGTILELDEKGRLSEDTWPNVGVGRINLDGSKGSCSSCHSRHRFSIAEARKPEACGQCHLGPDHPQMEIYAESKHGAIYDAFGDEYNWDAAPGTWSPGLDYRAPTCASCHMSGSGKQHTTHDVTERLSWELQAPLTIHPENFGPWPSKSNWKVERDKMKNICKQCHAKNWVVAHYKKTDAVVKEYNEVYFKPAKAMLDKLYSEGLLDDTKFFDEHLEVEFYTLWHYEGRRARMGTAMMAPDYAWWHGFYELKHRYNTYMKEARSLLKTGEKAHIYEDYPNATGDTTRPPVIFNQK